MTSICEPCALRLSRAANQASSGTTRAFSTTSARSRSGAIPSFPETSHSELNKTLTSFRNKHIIPAYLSPHERRLVFGHKYRQLLIDNPQIVEVAGEQIQLRPLDIRKQIPARKTLINTTLRLLRDKCESKDWSILPQLLTGLNKVSNEIDPALMEKIVRTAIQSGHLGIVIVCLQKSAETGMTLKDKNVRKLVLWGVRSVAQRDGWSKEAVNKALKDANQIALLMESEAHGGGDKFVLATDARAKSGTLGVFLELAAVHAYKHQGGQDRDGKVKAYLQRMLSSHVSFVHTKTISETKGPRYELLVKLPMYHGYSLARKVLPEDALPQDSAAVKVLNGYEDGLRARVEMLVDEQPKPGSYPDQIITAWNSIIRA